MMVHPAGIWAACLAVASAGEAPAGEARLYINPEAITLAAEAYCAGKSAESLERELARSDCPADMPSQHVAVCQAMRAEVFRILGSGWADGWYLRAIRSDSTDPGPELLYGRYLSRYRGPGVPILPGADVRLWQAYRKMTVLEGDSGSEARFSSTYATRQFRLQTKSLAAEIHRGEGMLLYPLPSFAADSLGPLRRARPGLRVFLASKVAKSTGINDLERVDDMRTYSAEALTVLARNTANNYRLAGLVRAKEQAGWETRARLRSRLPLALDLFFAPRTIARGQITDYHRPLTFNDVSLVETGARLGSPFSLYRTLDGQGEAAFRRIYRTGLVEFHPGKTESVDQWEGRAALGWNSGVDRVLIQGAGVLSRIRSFPESLERKRSMGSLQAEYQAYGHAFAGNGFILGLGAASDDEWYGDTLVSKRDYFAKAACLGWGPADITWQPALMTYAKDFDILRDNLFLRNAFLLTYRMFPVSDPTRYDVLSQDPSLPRPFPFLGRAYLAIPLSHEFGLDGMRDFENLKAGCELHVRFLEDRGGTALYLQAGYSRQEFYRIGKGFHHLRFSLSFG